MTDLVLYTNPNSRGRIARWMLEEAGVPYRAEIVAYGADMKGPVYRAINPMGKVPALVHGGRVVTECAAICAYVADAFPDAGLAPAPADRASYYRWLFFAAGPVEQAVTLKSLGVEPKPEQRGFVGTGSVDTIADILAEAVGDGPWLLGAQFTAADVYGGAQVAWGLQFGSLPARPQLEAWVTRCRARDAHQRAAAADNGAA